MKRSFDQISQLYSLDVQAVAERARRLIAKVLPGSTESIDPSVCVASYGYGPGYKDMVCTLILSKSGVKIGLVRGANLPDPHHLLQGRGKTHKYIQLRTPADLDRPAVAQLLRAARKAFASRQKNTESALIKRFSTPLRD